MSSAPLRRSGVDDQHVYTSVRQECGTVPRIREVTYASPTTRRPWRILEAFGYR